MLTPSYHFRLEQRSVNGTEVEQRPDCPWEQKRGRNVAISRHANVWAGFDDILAEQRSACNDFEPFVGVS